jgi:hypothetical protein
MQIKIFSLAIAVLAFSQINAQEKSSYGRTIISLAPVQVTNTGSYGEPAAGPGLNLEYFAGKNDKIAISLPLGASFFSDGAVRYAAFHAMPGIKFYPKGGNRKVAYAVGGNMAFLYSRRPVANWNTATRTIENRFGMGVMVFNSINFNPSAHLYAGIDAGLGLYYLGLDDNTDFGVPPMLVNLAFKIGYRF